ncbi:MAG: hypothetical protein ABL995_05715 [Bryobacteraceae bacterium]
MKLNEFALEELAKMVVGDAAHFPYRSSYYITKFFERCDLPFTHDGTTRAYWAKEKLAELNVGHGQSDDLPSDTLCRVISELFEPDDFARHNNKMKGRGEDASNNNLADRPKALAALNELLKRYRLVAYFDDADRCYLRSTGSGTTTTTLSRQTRPLSLEEIEQRRKVAKFLDDASEDEFIEKLLVPLFQRLGFRRVSMTGHKDKLLEFGRDLWMKYQLPTSHWLYFCAQVKKDKIDSNNASGVKNVSSVLNQARMAIDHPIFDPESNRKVLLDHILLISAGEITKAARAWLVEQLDQGQRRHIIFMDREELLDQSARILSDLRLVDDISSRLDDNNVPF